MKIIINDNSIEHTGDGGLEELSIIQNSVNTDICNAHYHSFSNMLSNLLNEYHTIKTLKLMKLNCNMFDEVNRETLRKIEDLTVYCCDINENDMILLGPCFSQVKKICWFMNRFDEALFDQYVDPYFEIHFNMDYENDDGWYPGCEIWGDRQLLQYKNNSYYF